MKTTRPFHPIAGLLFLALCACQKVDPEDIGPDYTRAVKISSDPVNLWYDLSLKLTKETPGFSAPVAARAYAYIGLTLYESVSAGMKGYQSLQGRLEGFAPGTLPEVDDRKDFHWGFVANAALAQAFRKFYRDASPENLAEIDEREERYYRFHKDEAIQQIRDRSIFFGRRVADAIFQFAVTDGQENCHKNNFPDYTIPTGPGYWVPTSPTPKALLPYWGEVRTFKSKLENVVQPPAPTAFSRNKNSIYYANALEVYTTIRNLRSEQHTLAWFWSDDAGLTATPAGHSISILRQVLQQENASLAVAAEAYAKLGMAVHNSYVACWKTMYTYYVQRPVTYIQAQIDPDFSPSLIAPLCPEYPSSHSTQITAVATVLSDLFGYNYAFTDATHKDRDDFRGEPRHYDTFLSMADEATIALLYGGIHYRPAIEEGAKMGIRIARNISLLPFTR